MRNDSAKLQVRLWKYKSNPVLKDTDFDGLEDGFGYEIKNGIEVPVALNIPYDKRPKDNYFTGRMHTTRMTGNDAIKVDMNMDYRYFFLSNKMYYDELSTMSLLYANSIYRKGSGQSMHSGLQLRSANNLININNGKLLYSKEEIDNISIDSFNNLQVKEMMEHFGFKDVKTYYMGEEGDEAADGADVCRGYKDTHKGKVALGYKNIEYHGLYKTVIGIVIRGTAEDDDWDSDFDMGDLDLRDELNYAGGRKNYDDNYDKIYIKLLNGILNYDKKYATELLHFAGGYPDWIWDYHHAGFDIVSNRILEVLNEYITAYDSNFENDICFWVTGHSMGGGVANLVAASLVYGECGGNVDNVYCYTFAAPNTYYLTDKDEEAGYPNATKYRCIFNVVNGDDFVTKVPMKECNWTRYGRVAIKSIENDVKPALKQFIGPIQNKHHYNYIIDDYKSNKAAVDIVIIAFDGMYDDKNNMRNDSYTYDNKVGKADIKYKTKEDLEENILYYAEYTKPYQKNNFHKGLFKSNYIQNQMPAYLMLSIAYSMHSYIKDKDTGEYRLQNNNKKFLDQDVSENQYILLTSRFGFNSWGAKWSLVATGSPIINGVECPHYLESYYTLTEEISTLDFK